MILYHGHGIVNDTTNLQHHGIMCEVRETRSERGGGMRGRPASDGLPRLTHTAATIAAATIVAETHVRLKTMYDLDVGDHVVLPGEFFVANRAGVVLDVRLVRGDVVPAEVADVCIGAMAHGASINVALLHAEVPHRALRALVLGLERALEVALTDLRFAGHHAKYGTAYAVLRHRLRFHLGVRVLLLLLIVTRGRRGLTLQRRRAELLAKASLEVDADMSRRLAAIATAARRLLQF